MFNNKFSNTTLRFTDSVEKAVDRAIEQADKTVSSFWSVLDHPDFPFVTLESTTNTQRNFPPYNIVDIGDGQIRLDIAVAGYTKDRLAVELQGNILSIKGTQSDPIVKKATVSPTDAAPFDKLGTVRKRGISDSTFLRTFEMQPNTVVNGVRFQDGILSILVAATKTEEPKKSFVIG